MSDCLVERVARAMFDKLLVQTDPWPFAHGNDPTCVVMDGSFDLTEIAVWAVEAMRSPTPEMIEAWSVAAPTKNTDDDSLWTDQSCATADWQAMIDAALK